MNPEISLFKTREIFRIAFFVFAILLAGYFFLMLPRIAIPIGISYVLFLVLNPMIPILRILKLSRVAAVAIVFITFMVLAIFPIVKLVPIVVEESENFQYYIPKIEQVTWNTYHSVGDYIKSRTGYSVKDEHLSNFIQYMNVTSKNVLKNIPQALASLIEWIFIIPLILFFMLKDGVRFRTIVLKITPNSFFERFYHLFSQLNRQFGDYLLAKFIEAAIVGVFITLGLLLAGIKFSLLFGFIAAITNIIPYIGPIIGAIPAIIWAFSEYGFGQESLVVVTIFLVANVIDLAIVFPILVSKIVDMHPIVVVLSVILGSQFMGVTGMIISIPVAAALKLFFVEIFNSLYTGQR